MHFIVRGIKSVGYDGEQFIRFLYDVFICKIRLNHTHLTQPRRQILLRYKIQPPGSKRLLF